MAGVIHSCNEVKFAKPANALETTSPNTNSAQAHTKADMKFTI